MAGSSSIAPSPTISFLPQGKISIQQNTFSDARHSKRYGYTKDTAVPLKLFSPDIVEKFGSPMGFTTEQGCSQEFFFVEGLGYSWLGCVCVCMCLCEGGGT